MEVIIENNRDTGPKLIDFVIWTVACGFMGAVLWYSVDHGSYLYGAGIGAAIGFYLTWNRRHGHV